METSSLRTAAILDTMRFQMLIKVPLRSEGLDRERIRDRIINKILEMEVNSGCDEARYTIEGMILDGLIGLRDLTDNSLADNYEQMFVDDCYMEDETAEAVSMVFALRMYALVEQTRMQAAIDEWVWINDKLINHPWCPIMTTDDQQRLMENYLKTRVKS